MKRRAFTLFPLLGIASLCDAVATSPPRLIIAVEFSLPKQTAEWVVREVTTPCERAFGRLAGLTSMQSMSGGSRCLIELGYAGSPSVQALLEAQSVARETWAVLEGSIPEPMVSIREARLG